MADPPAEALTGSNEIIAGKRRTIGLPRKEKIVRVVSKDPSCGGSEGYPEWLRNYILDRFNHDGTIIRSSKASVYRWKKSPGRLVKTGNKKQGDLTGGDQFLLVLFKRAYPESKADHVRTFIMNNSMKHSYYSHMAISRALKRLTFSRKRSSKVAHLAFTKKNLFRRKIFHTERFPVGKVGIPRARLIDVDECGLELRSTDPHYGHAVKGLRVVHPGNYTRDTKVTVIAAIEPGDPSLPANVDGSMNRPRRWIRVSTEKGTTSDVYKTFLLNKICDSFNADEPQRTSMHDNLGAHMNPLLYRDVKKRGHRILNRPPYYPADGPIEWIFNQLGCELRNRASSIKNIKNLITEIHSIFANMTGFDDTFRKCEYSV